MKMVLFVLFLCLFVPVGCGNPTIFVCKRYYYGNGVCIETGYGICVTGDNSFSSLSVCASHCMVSPPDVICNEAVQPQTCYRHFYDPVSNQCKECGFTKCATPDNAYWTPSGCIHCIQTVCLLLRNKPHREVSQLHHYINEEEITIAIINASNVASLLIQLDMKLNDMLKTLLDREGADRPERRMALVEMELAKYNIDTIALCETKFSESGSLNDLEYSFFWSGKPEGERREAGIGLLPKRISSQSCQKCHGQ
ncbi:hypothetical protein LSH36_9g09049 [Paralvinella palmiformis]|uniref:Uncharacterized protein n=1 Tax=Paralvinella palmiformis TaxID=53620 RepID=A0AAD9NGT2_9ANNE|nr:hypothetical protein LSH36_9g09049 [Paralvinella palmiformis]